MANYMISESKAQNSQDNVAQILASQGETLAHTQKGQRLLQEGANVALNDTLTTAGSSVLVLKFANGAVVTLGHDQELTLDQKFLQLLEDIAEKDSVGEVINFDRIAQALEDGQTLDEILPAPAAGDPNFVAGAGTAGIRIEYTGDSVTPTSGFETEGIGFEALIPDEIPGREGLPSPEAEEPPETEPPETEPPVLAGPSVSVSDDNGAVGGDQDIAENAAGTVSGSFRISADAGLQSINVDGNTITEAQLLALEAGTGTIVLITTTDESGSLTITGYNSGTRGELQLRGARCGEESQCDGRQHRRQHRDHRH